MIAIQRIADGRTSNVPDFVAETMLRKYPRQYRVEPVDDFGDEALYSRLESDGLEFSGMISEQRKEQRS
jgi:hypothetical protein